MNSMDNEIRLNKYLSDAGVCSRRQADKFIEEGKVTVDGEVAYLGTRISKDSKVCLDGKPVSISGKTVIYAYNKPRGYVCTSKTADKDSIFNYVDFPIKVNYVGRLDKDSQGLLLLTNDGDLANAIQKSRNNHEKEYIVRINKYVSDDFIKNMSNGVPILDTVTKKCKVERVGTRSFRIILTQGLNRQIRRMCEYFDVKVSHLKRIRIMNVKLGNLKLGEYRKLTKEEERELRKQCGC